jgi:hypothetical protein
MDWLIVARDANLELNFQKHKSTTGKREHKTGAPLPAWVFFFLSPLSRPELLPTRANEESHPTNKTIVQRAKSQLV